MKHLGAPRRGRGSQAHSTRRVMQRAVGSKPLVNTKNHPLSNNFYLGILAIRPVEGASTLQAFFSAREIVTRVLPRPVILFGSPK